MRTLLLQDKGVESAENYRGMLVIKKTGANMLSGVVVQSNVTAKTSEVMYENSSTLTHQNRAFMVGPEALSRQGNALFRYNTPEAYCAAKLGRSVEKFVSDFQKGSFTDAQKKEYFEEWKKIYLPD